MKVMKTISFLIVLAVAVFLVRDASANLPGSTYGAQNGWQGYKTYSQNGIDCTLTFNVYDIVANPGEIAWAGNVDFPAGDRYVYAYQLFSNSLSTKDIAYFGILDKSGNPIAQTLMNATQAVDDGSGVTPDPNPCTEQGKWIWSAGVGFVAAGQHSVYLLFSSIYAPTKGKFEVKSSDESDNPTPDGPVPEPATIVLLGVTSAFLLAGRNRRHRPA